MNKRCGFSMLELLGVLVILTLLGSFITISTARMQKQAQIEDVVSAITHLDDLLRWHARDAGILTALEVDLEARSIRISYFERESNRLSSNEDPTIEQYQLPESLHVQQVWVSQYASPTRKFSSSRIVCTPEGMTRSYAIELAGANQETHFLLFAGLTGQYFALEQRNDVEAIFDQLEKLHAD